MPKPYPHRWAVFQHDQYYPSGGIADLKGTYATEEEAKESASKSPYDDAYVVDLIHLAETGHA